MILHNKIYCKINIELKSQVIYLANPSRNKSFIEKNDIQISDQNRYAILINESKTQITQAEGDYLFKVKRNKKHIVNDIDQEFYYNKTKSLPILSFKAEGSKAHGRIDERHIEVIKVGDKYFSGLDTITQIARITRTYYTMKTKVEKSELHYVMTSLPAAKASPEDL